MLFKLACASIVQDSGLNTYSVISCYELTMLQALIQRRVLSQTVLTILKQSVHNEEIHQCDASEPPAGGVQYSSETPEP